MNIKNQVKISLLIFCILVTIIIISVFFSYYQFEEKQKEQQVIDTIKDTSFDLYFLESDYLAHEDNVLIDRWHVKYEDLIKSIQKLQNSNDLKNHELIQDISRYCQEMNLSFSNLIAVKSKGNIAMYPDDNSDIKTFYGSTLEEQTQMLMSSSTSLSQLIKSETRDFQQLIILVIFFSLIGLILFVFFNYYLINRKILSSVTTFQKGADDIRSGNLTTRIEICGDNELTSLAASFNSMVISLKTAQDQLLDSNIELKHENDERKKAEAVLLQTNNYLESLISIANVPIIVWDPSNKITRVNHAFEILTGRYSDELIGQSLNVLFFPGQVEHSLESIRNDGKGLRWKSVQMDLLHRDGTLRNVIWNSATLYSSDGNTVIATIAQGRDITEEKRLEMDRDAALHQIQVNLAQLAILNDGIRNPLTIIIAYAEMLHDTKIVEQIINQAHRIDNMVSQLDRRWMESEKVLNAIRRHYHIQSDHDGGTHISGDQGMDIPGFINGKDPSSYASEKLIVEEVQAQLSTILDSIDALVYVADMDTYDLLFMNKKGRSLYGEPTGKKCYSTIYNNTSPCDFCTNHLLVDELGPTGVYHWENRDPAQDRWYDCRDRAIQWSTGKLVRLEITTDITERKNTEMNLQENEEKFRKIFDNINDGIHIHEIAPDGRPGKFIEVNEVACRMLQYSRLELLAHGPLDFVTSYHSRPVSEIVHELSLYGRSIFETEHIRKDGTIIPVEINAHIADFKNNKVIISVIRDISGRKTIENALSESERKFQEICKKSPVAFQLYNAQGTLMYVNPAFLELFGVEKMEKISHFSLFSDLHLDDGNRQKLIRGEGVQYQTMVDFDQVTSQELFSTTRSGMMWLNVLISPLDNEHGIIDGFIVQVMELNRAKEG